MSRSLAGILVLVAGSGFVLADQKKTEIAAIRAQIKELQRKYPKVIGDTDGIGMALRIEICQADGFEPDRELTDKIFAEGMKGDLDARGRRTGLVLDIGGYYKNVFTLAPCFDMTEEEIDIAVELFEQLIRRCAPERINGN